MKECPEITVISSKPNNGYLALVFTDDGVMFTSNCNREDAYNGLLRITADLLLECVESIQQLPESKEDDIDKFMNVMMKAHLAYSTHLRDQMGKLMIEKRLVKSGMPELLANLIASKLEELSEELSKKLDDTKDDAEDDAEK